MMKVDFDYSLARVWSSVVTMYVESWGSFGSFINIQGGFSTSSSDKNDITIFSCTTIHHQVAPSTTLHQ